MKEWDQLVQATCPVSGRLRFTTEHSPDGPKRFVKAAVLDVSFTDDEGVQGFVDVSYTNATSFDAGKTLRAARTPGKAASEREVLR